MNRAISDKAGVLSGIPQEGSVLEPIIFVISSNMIILVHQNPLNCEVDRNDHIIDNSYGTRQEMESMGCNKNSLPRFENVE